MEKRNNIRFNIIAIICILIFGITLTPKSFQNDTYYTIKIGEYITQNGIDMLDPFSWHENMSYTYPHWLYDYCTYWIYHLFGFAGVYIVTVILACILGLVLYYTNCKVGKNKLVSLILTLTVMWLTKSFIAARAQLITFIFFVLEICFIEGFINTKKKRYGLGLITLSLLIANMHVAVWPFFFILFLPYIAEYIIVIIRDKHFIYRIVSYLKKSKIRRWKKKNKSEEKIAEIEKELTEYENKFERFKFNQIKATKNPYRLKLERKDNVKFLFIILIICALMGLLTPIKDTPYTYLYKTMQGNTTDSINEHQPTVLINNKPALYTIGLLLAILILTDTKITVRDLFLILGLIILMLMSRRQASLYMLIGVFVFNKLICSLIDKYDPKGTKETIGYITSILGMVITISIMILLGAWFAKDNYNEEYVNKESYPVEAANWIKENLDLENIKLFNEYNYGSYLLFQDIPVFIDSRADLYTPEFNEKNIFSDFLSISSIGTYYEDKFREYEITHVILKNNTKLKMLISRDENYKELYNDDNFVIYERLGKE